MTLERHGWRIEIAGAESAKVWDSRTSGWRPAAIDFDAAELHEVDGVRLPVMPRSQLIDYKRGLGREVDRGDLDQLSG